MGVHSIKWAFTRVSRWFHAVSRTIFPASRKTAPSMSEAPVQHFCCIVALKHILYCTHHRGCLRFQVLISTHTTQHCQQQEQWNLNKLVKQMLHLGVTNAILLWRYCTVRIDGESGCARIITFWKLCTDCTKKCKSVTLYVYLL